MKKESITFSVQMTAREVYRFTFYHVYHGFSGMFGLCLSLLALLYLFTNFNATSDMGKTVLIIVGAWYTVFEPMMMVSRSQSQVKRNKAYQKPLNYRVDADGITVSQDDQSQTMTWDKISKIVETNSQFLVYSSRIHSFIFPKSMLDGQEKDMRYLLIQYTLDSNVKVKGKMRKLYKLARLHKERFEEEMQ